MDCHTFWVRRGKEKTQSGKGSSGPNQLLHRFRPLPKNTWEVIQGMYVLTNAGYVSMYVLVIMKGIYITSFKYFGFKGFETGFFFDLMVAVGTDFPSQKLRASL